MHKVFRNLTIVLITSGAIKSWQPGETINTSDLNANFTHIHTKMVGGHGARLVNSDVNGSANIDSSKLAAYRYIPIAWVEVTTKCTSGTCTVAAEENVSGVTRSSAGKYVVSFENARSVSNYAVVASSHGPTGTECHNESLSGANTTTSFDITCLDYREDGGTATSAQDSAFSAVVFEH